MRTTVLAAILLVASPALAAPKTFDVEGKKLSVDVEPVKPPVELSQAATSKVPAIATYFDYMRALAGGDINAAAALTAQPDKTKAEQKAYLERLGSIDALKARYGSALTAHLKVTHLVTKGEVTMLIGEHPEHGTFANFLVCKSGKCLVNNHAEAPAIAELASLFGAVREEKVKL